MSELNGNGVMSAKKRLWIMTELYHPEYNQTGYYITHIGEGLAKDFDVKVICSQPNYSSRGTIAPRHEVYNNVEIFRVRGTTLNRSLLLFRFLNMVTNGLSTVFTGLRKVKSSDEVLTISAPPSLPFLAALTARLKGAPYSVIIHDKYPEQLVALKKLPPGSPIIKIFNRLNRWLYSNARNIIVVGRDMEELVAAQSNLQAGKAQNVVTIPNWAALEEVEPRPKNENELLKQLGISDKFVFLYAGNMSHPQDVESIIECARQLKDHDEIRFVFIGGGMKRKWIESEIKDKQLKNVYLLDPLPREQQTLFLNACDVGLVSLVKNMYGLAMPSRTYNLLAAGKPILALTEKNSEVERLIQEEKVGWTVEPQNPEKLLKIIETIYSRRDELEEMGAVARRSAVERYDAGSSIEKYRSVMRVGGDGLR